MSVDVTVMPAVIPHRLRDEDLSRVREFKDRGDATYRYSVHASGSLIIWKAAGDKMPEVDSVYGPSSWEVVQGDLFSSLA